MCSALYGIHQLIPLLVFFPAGIFNETFKSLSNVNPKVLYPIPNFKALDQPLETSADIIPPNKTTIFLSINRYERKKNLNLAVESFGMYNDVVDLLLCKLRSGCTKYLIYLL